MSYSQQLLWCCALIISNAVIASDDHAVKDENATLSAGPAYYIGNKQWQKGKDGWSYGALKMTVSDLKAAREECKKSKAEGCYIGYESFRKNNKGNHGWHCGARGNGPDGKYLSPIDYACWKHDREKYGKCGLHHALYCRYVHKGGSDPILKDLNRIHKDFVNYQGMKCYGKKYPYAHWTYKDMPDCNSPRN